MAVPKTRTNPMNEVGSGFPVEHGLNVPLHIIGHGRSGTSIFGALCRKYLGIGAGTESQFIMRYYRRRDRFGDFSDVKTQRRFLSQLLTERYFQRSKKFNIHLTVDDILKNVRDRTFAGMLDATFASVADSLGMTRWGDKSPEYILNLPVLEELFPTSQYIHVVRDGRDVAMSSKATANFGCNNSFSAALDWRSKVRLAREFGETLPPSRFLEIRYEDLLDAPLDTFEQVAQFLQIKNRRELLEYMSERVPKELMVGNHSKWKTQLNDAEIQRYESIAGAELAQLSYEVREEGNREPPAWERAYWKLDSKLRDMTRWGYWKDNFYKASLRLRGR